MAKKHAVFAYADGSDGDLLEQAMAHWAERGVNKFRAQKRSWHIKTVPESQEASFREALMNAKNACIVALWGHGRARDGAFLDATGIPIIHPENAYLLSGMSVFAMFCHSAKLLDNLHDSSTPKTALCFQDEIWLIIYPEGESFPGFEKAATKALAALLSGKDGAFAARKFRRESSHWAMQWLCRLWLELVEESAVEARNAFLCISAFLNNVESVSEC